VIGSDLIPRHHVPGEGPVPARVMLVGEAPGFNENRAQRPFIGLAGKELDRYLRSAGIMRDECYVTNLAKYWPPQTPQGKQLPPSPADIARDEPELLMELDMVRPEIIGAVGAHAARYFLGDRFKSMHRDHGIPHTLRGNQTLGRGLRHDHKYFHFDTCIVPIVHPSAGLHSPAQQVQIQWDFLQLGKVLRGQIPPHPPINTHPEPFYEILSDDQDGVEQLKWILAGKTEISIDTEGDLWEPECLTFSVQEGDAYMILPESRECLAALDAWINAPGGVVTVIFHYAAHDIPVVEPNEKLRRLSSLGVRVNKYRTLNSDGSLTMRCTMSELYLLGGVHPKGLKPASWRLVGGELEDYTDVVGPTEQARSLAYVEKVWIQFLCQNCWGTGKAEKYDIVDPECPDCNGTGRVPGARLNTTKKCPGCVKTTDKCPACAGGLRLPMPDLEFVFDADKAEFRWKQPQPLAKWIKRRLEGAAADNGWEEDGTTGDAADDEDEGSEYFKLRHDWNDLADRNDKRAVEDVLGPMPRTKLFDVPDLERVKHYACSDADYTLRVAHKTQPLLAEHKVTEIQRIDAAVIPMLSHMEQTGMMIAREDCERFAGELDAELDEIRTRLSDLVGEKTNPNSPKVAQILFHDLGLPVIKLTKSKTREAIDDDVLGALKAALKKREHDPIAGVAVQVIDCVTDYRERLKLLTTYCRPLLRKADRSNRVHTTLNYSTVATGRLSSEDPNLQNIPNPDNSPVYGRRLRNLFIAKSGSVLISADYSQIEMVVGAHLTQDPGMLEVFRRGLDLHTYAASMMFGLEYEKVPKHIRTQVKPLNFGCFYGLSAIGLRDQFASLPSGAIEKTEEECQELIDRYYAAFPGVLEWKKRLWRNARVTGYVETLFGRKRIVPGLRSDIDKVRSAAEREAGNQPIQGTAQDILKIGMERLWTETLPECWSAGIDIDPLMQVHDEVIFECQEDAADFAMPMIEDAMKNAVALSVPIKVGVSKALRWGELK
jgi:uracil-DNA glycosylase family 4